MSVQALLAQIRHPWIHRVSHDVARGEGVRENFTHQLERFYDLIGQAISTGDSSWIDPVLFDWANSPTQSDLQEGAQNMATLFTKLSILTVEVAREKLSPDEALEVIAAVMPVYTYAIAKSIRFESDARVTYISNESTSVQRTLERLDKSKSNFIAVAAHELKTPLTLIEGYTAMMNDLISRVEEKEKEQLDALLQGVHNGVRRLREIVDDMIDVSLIDNSMLSLNLQPLWLSHILGLLKSEVADAVEKRKIHLEVRDFEGSEELIFADPERLCQAFRNIVTNAIKYTPDGGDIIIDGRSLPGFIEVTIEDTGIGISPEDQATIFEKFGQTGQASLHSSGKIKFKGGGPGLGLPIARGIIEAHGGTIWVESEGYDEEKCPGSTFHVLLPARGEPNDTKIAKLFKEKNTANSVKS